MMVLTEKKKTYNHVDGIKSNFVDDERNKINPLEYNVGILYACSLFVIFWKQYV